MIFVVIPNGKIAIVKKKKKNKRLASKPHGLIAVFLPKCRSRRAFLRIRRVQTYRTRRASTGDLLIVLGKNSESPRDRRRTCAAADERQVRRREKSASRTRETTNWIGRECEEGDTGMRARQRVKTTDEFRVAAAGKTGGAGAVCWPVGKLTLWLQIAECRRSRGRICIYANPRNAAPLPGGAFGQWDRFTAQPVRGETNIHIHTRATVGVRL